MSSENENKYVVVLKDQELKAIFQDLDAKFSKASQDEDGIHHWICKSSSSPIEIFKDRRMSARDKKKSTVFIICHHLEVLKLVFSEIAKRVTETGAFVSYKITDKFVFEDIIDPSKFKMTDLVNPENQELFEKIQKKFNRVEINDLLKQKLSTLSFIFKSKLSPENDEFYIPDWAQFLAFALGIKSQLCKEMNNSDEKYNNTIRNQLLHCSDNFDVVELKTLDKERGPEVWSDSEDTRPYPSMRKNHDCLDLCKDRCSVMEIISTLTKFVSRDNLQRVRSQDSNKNSTLLSAMDPKQFDGFKECLSSGGFTIENHQKGSYSIKKNSTSFFTMSRGQFVKLQAGLRRGGFTIENYHEGSYTIKRDNQDAALITIYDNDCIKIEGDDHFLISQVLECIASSVDQWSFCITRPKQLVQPVIYFSDRRCSNSDISNDLSEALDDLKLRGLWDKISDWPQGQNCLHFLCWFYKSHIVLPDYSLPLIALSVLYEGCLKKFVAEPFAKQCNVPLSDVKCLYSGHSEQFKRILNSVHDYRIRESIIELKSSRQHFSECVRNEILHFMPPRETKVEVVDLLSRKEAIDMICNTFYEINYIVDYGIEAAYYEEFERAA